MKFILVIVAMMSFSGLAACQPGTSGNIATSDMDGGSDGGSGSGY